MTMPDRFIAAMEAAAGFVGDHQVVPLAIDVRRFYAPYPDDRVQASIQLAKLEAERVLEPDAKVIRADNRVSGTMVDVLVAEGLVVVFMVGKVFQVSPQTVADVFGGAS